MTKRVVSLVKFFASCAILLIVLREVELESVASALREISIAWLPAIVALAILENLLMVAKLTMLFEGAGVSLGMWTTLRLRFVSSFLGLALPAGVGSDVVMLAQLKRHQQALALGAGALIADRVMGVLSMVTIAAIAIVFLVGELINPSIRAFIVVALFGSWGAAGLLCWPKTITPLRAFVRRLEQGSLQSSLPTLLTKRLLYVVSKVQLALHEIGRARTKLQIAMVLTFAVQFVRIMFVLLLFRSIGVDVATVYVFAFVPIVTVLVSIPISFFGLGVQEGALVYLFNTVGVQAELSLAVSLLIYVVHLTLVISAGLYFLYVRPIRPREQRPRT